MWLGYIFGNTKILGFLNKKSKWSLQQAYESDIYNFTYSLFDFIGCFSGSAQHALTVCFTSEDWHNKCDSSSLGILRLPPVSSVKRSRGWSLILEFKTRKTFEKLFVDDMYTNSALCVVNIFIRYSLLHMTYFSQIPSKQLNKTYKLAC